MSDLPMNELKEMSQPKPPSRGKGSFGTMDQAIKIFPLSPEETRDSLMRGNTDFTEYLREHKLGTPEGGRRRSPVKKVKKEVVRERRQPIPPIGPEQRQLTPKTQERRSFVRDRSQDIITEPPVARRSYQDLPPLELPPLPKYSEEKIKSEKRMVIQRELIESMPDMKEPAKKLRPPPKVYNIPKQGSMPRRRGQPAEAPVSSKEIQQMQDPLNFLVKYCIIHPDRLPYYEWVFQAVISEQIPKYKRTSHVTTYHNGVREASSDCQLSPHEMSMLHDITVINHGQIPEKVGLSVPEQYLEKTCYTFDMLQEKYRKMEHQLHKMEVKKINLMAHLAREMFPDITKVDYQVKAAKKGKKGKKNKSEEPEPIQRLLRKEDINDEVIVGRLDDKMISVLNKRKDIAHFEVAIDRTMEKLAGLENRLEHIEQEKKMLDVYCMECYFQGKTDGNRPMEFRRQQSSLYNKLHPKIDFEIELDKVESALQQINNNLLTDKELVYLYHILNLPGRRRLSFRLFSIVAALSEKVTQLDPILRKLLNKLDYNALDVRMSKCKELFSLLQDGEIVPSGNALASCLRVELAAGGMTPEHTSHVLSKFNRDGKGLVDFLDFVMYMPLFIKIHNRIVKDPLREDLDL